MSLLRLQLSLKMIQQQTRIALLAIVLFLQLRVIHALET